MSSKYFDIRIDGAQLQRDIAAINRQIGLISKNMQKEGQEIDAITARIGQGLAGAFSVFTAGKFVKDIASVRGEFQQLEVAFETMLGSREKADKLMQEVVQFAARTPFELSEVASGTKQLLAFGVEAEKVIPTLKAMGDVSAGLSVPIERLITNFGQVRTQTKMTGRELRDFQMAGVPIVAELAKNLNVSEQAIADMVTAGKVGFKEVEEAFISMTSEGGRFSSLMEKQAKTITGLASNFADAWDRMLNSIGKENEGIIAGSIQGAITLVENYEEVIKVLGLLIATYGTYKAAVIATSVVEGTAAAAGNIRAWFELARGIRSAKDAQIAFNLATKANPYAFVAAAIASLISYLLIFRDRTKETQDYIDDLNDSISSIGKQIEVDTLINRYVELQDKTGKTKEEQAELNKTVAELGRLFPGLVSQTDSYGKALDLAKDKVIQLNDQLRENARVTTQKQVTDAQDVLNQKIEERARLLKEANQGYVETFVEFSQGQRMPIMVELVPKAIEERRKKVEELNAEIANLTNTIGESESKLMQLGQLDAGRALEPYRQLFGEVEKYSREQALKIKIELTKLLGLGLGADAEKMIKGEIDKIATQLALPTVQAQIKQVLADLKNAENQLAQLRAPGARSNPDQIKDKETEIKDLKDKYEALTGINAKEAKKQLEDQKKAEKEKLKAIIEFQKEELTLERQLQASKIAIMQQGGDRRKAEAELQYQQELDRIALQQQAYLEAWNATQGFEPGDVGFISELPEEDIERFTRLRVNAEQKKNKEIVAIEKDAAIKIGEIRRQTTEAFLSDQQREISAVEDKYADLNQKALDSGDFEALKAIEEARKKELYDIDVKYALMSLDFQEEIELRRAEIDAKQFGDQLKLEENKISLYRKYAKKRLEILSKVNTDAARAEMVLLKVFLAELDKGMEDLGTKKALKVTREMGEIARAVGEIDSEVGKVIGSMGQLADNAIKAVGGFAKGGDAMQGITGVIGIVGTLVSLVSSGNAAPKSLLDTIERMNKTLQKQAEILAALNGENYFELAKTQAQGYYRLINESEKTLLNSLGKNIFTSWFKDWGIDTADEIIKKYSEGFSGFNEDQIELISTIIEAKEKLNRLMDESWEKATGSTRDSIADSLIQGFIDGKRSAEDFADSFEEMMRKAVLNSIKTQLLEGPIVEFMRSFGAMAEDGLTAEEITQARLSFANLLTSSRELWDGLTDLSGLNFLTDAAKPEGLTGAIQGITEETASLIAGQFYAMRELNQRQYLTGLEQLDVMNQSVTHLAEIANNTRHNQKLVSIDQRIEDMNNYLKAIL